VEIFFSWFMSINFIKTHFINSGLAVSRATWRLERRLGGISGHVEAGTANRQFLADEQWAVLRRY
jgi:hypothetical protein